MTLSPWPEEEPLPPVSRRYDPETSKIAERMIAGRRPSQMVKLLLFYEVYNLTDEQAADLAEVLHQSATKRCADLRNAGLIEPTGAIRKGSAGMPQMVCRITDDGRRVLRERRARRA